MYLLLINEVSYCPLDDMLTHSGIGNTDSPQASRIERSDKGEAAKRVSYPLHACYLTPTPTASSSRSHIDDVNSNRFEFTFTH